MAGNPAMRWKLILTTLLVVAALGAGLGFFWPFGRKGQTLTLPGVVEIQEVRLGSKIAGRVAEVLINEGDIVKPGQLLVRLEAPELEAQREQQRATVQAAEAQSEKAQNGPRPEEKEAALDAWDAAKARLKRLEEGFRKEEIEQTRSDWEAADTDARLARDELDRAERLFRKGTISQAEYDSAKAANDRARKRAASARARLDLMEAGSRKEDIDEAKAEAKRAEANYRLLELGTRYEEKAEAAARVNEARAKLREIEANLREAEIRAPEDAVVEVLSVRKGDLVAAGQPIIRVLRTADLWVKVYVPETEIGRVPLGQTVEATVDCYSNRRFQGKIIQISSESEFTPRNVQTVDERHHQVFGVKVRVDDPQGIFKSGMAAEVVVPLLN
jgi:multidrug resistance efflux pump